MITICNRINQSLQPFLVIRNKTNVNNSFYQVEIPVTALPGDQSVFQTDLDQGVAKLRVTPGLQFYSY